MDINVIHKIGENDIGQALILEEGIVIAIEAAEGTNEMLRRCKPFLSNGNHSVLVKAPKPRQELKSTVTKISFASRLAINSIPPITVSETV